MARWLQYCLMVSAIIITFGYNASALALPYEVVYSILELSDLDRDFRDLLKVNVSGDKVPIRPIYRLDLDPDYIAYYEIDMGKDYVVLSSGPQSGDFRKAESGPDPGPTEVLTQQAEENGQRCDKFYRLSPLGLTICKNDNGAVVAASYNWTADVPEIEDWRQLDHMVKQGLDGFKKRWRKHAAQSKSDWAITDVFRKGEEKKAKTTDEGVLFPGSIVKLALGEKFRSVEVYTTNDGKSLTPLSSRSGWQQNLCKVLVGVCLSDVSAKVDPSAIRKTPNHLLYLKLEVHGNRTFVGNVLHWREIGFAIRIKGSDNEVITKHFAIDLHSKRFLRSSWSTLYEVRVPSEKDFPDYDHHICCYGCHSGSGSVAWAQVFGYYDRLAGSQSSKFSPNLYGNARTKAPLRMTNGVKRFVESIRPWVQPVDCKGNTYSSNMHLIAPWFRARQGSKSRVVSYLEGRKGSYHNNGASVSYGDKSWIESTSVSRLDKGFPVVFEIKLGTGSRHFVVATRYKKKHRRHRNCRTVKTGWWWGERNKEVCDPWEDLYHYELFLHYGWGGYNNKWQQITAHGGHVAYVVS